jgi:hypothetical protein
VEEVLMTFFDGFFFALGALTAIPVFLVSVAAVVLATDRIWRR